MEGTIGEIRLFAGNFSPKTWTYCSGQLLNISSNTALYAIVGTFYGGNGSSTFGIPDLRGRVAIGAGNGPGLTQRTLGQSGGSNSITLSVNQLATHNHQISNGGAIPLSGSVYAKVKVNSSAAAVGVDTPVNNYLSTDQQGNGTYSTTPPTTPTTLNAQALSVNTSQLSVTVPPLSAGITGGGQPYNNMKPFLGLAYIICVQGVFPPRN